jgi:hypothetical protein
MFCVGLEIPISIFLVARSPHSMQQKDAPMLRHLAMALAISCLLAVPAVAGGPSGTGSIPVRIKNVGSLPVGVSAKSGVVAPSDLLSSGRILSSNGVSQFQVKPGTFTAGAAKASTPNLVNKVRQFETRTFKTIYLQAQQDGRTATIVGAPSGVKF